MSLTFCAGITSEVSSQATLPSASVKVIVIANGPCGLSSVSSQAPMNLPASAVDQRRRRLRAQRGSHHERRAATTTSGTQGSTHDQLLLSSAAPPAISARSSAGRLAAEGFSTPTRIFPLVTSGS